MFLLEDSSAATNTTARAPLPPALPPPRSPGPSLPGLSLPCLGAHMEEKHGGKSLIYKSVNYGTRKFIISRKCLGSGYYRNYWPSGKWQDFSDSIFEYEPEADPNQKDELVTRERPTNLSSLRNIFTKSPGGFDDLSYCFCFNLLNM